MALDRPILITGSPRAGKTLVSEILRPAEEFLYVDEPLMIWNYGQGARPDDRRTAADATPAVRDWIRHECEQLLAQSGKERYMDVLSYHALRVPFVREVMPEAKIVFVVRDAEEAIPEMLFGWTAPDTVGRAVRRRWRSIRWHGLPRAMFRFGRNMIEARLRGRRASWGPRPPGLAQVLKESDIAKVVAYQWRAMDEIALDDLAQCPAESWLEVRMDRLLAQPRQELERLVAFCEPRDPESIIRHGLAYIDPDHEFEKKVHPTPDQWRMIRAEVEPLRRRLGYASGPAIRAEEGTRLS